jgi:hypothetical protein
MTVRYKAVNAVLLSEFLKEYRKVQALEARLAQQQKEIAAQQATVHNSRRKLKLLLRLY